MASLNKVFLIGNLTQDPELRYTPNGAAVTDLRLAINRVYTTKEGDRREEALFIDVTVWNRQAENCCQYLKKGRPVHVEGYLREESWTDKTTGEPRKKLKVEAERVQFLDSRRDGAPGGPAQDDDEYSPPPARRAAPPAEGRGGNGPSRGHTAPSAAPRRPPAAPAPDAEEEDIPF
jgi:single-strand DNA-binding protein